jgi:hypothetical protein
LLQILSKIKDIREKYYRILSTWERHEGTCRRHFRGARRRRLCSSFSQGTTNLRTSKRVQKKDNILRNWIQMCSTIYQKHWHFSHLSYTCWITIILHMI